MYVFICFTVYVLGLHSHGLHDKEVTGKETVEFLFIAWARGETLSGADCYSALGRNQYFCSPLTCYVYVARYQFTGSLLAQKARLR